MHEKFPGALVPKARSATDVTNATTEAKSYIYII